MRHDLESRIVRYIVSNVNRDLFLSIDEAVRLAYAKAHSRSVEDYKHTSRARPRAQSRRYMIDDALAGVMAQGNSSVLDTVPKGEKYVVVCSGSITLSHIELHENKWARPAKHRTMLALKNAILEPVTPDMFKEPPPKLDDSLHVVAVVLHPDAKASNQSEPKELLITVPYTNWQGYHLEVPLRKILLEYENDDQGFNNSVDGAWPTLREDLIEIEKTTSNKLG